MPDEDQRTPADSDAEQKNDAESTDDDADKSGDDKGEGEQSDADKKEDDKGKEDEVTIPKKEYNALQATKRKSEKKRGRSQPKDSSPSGAQFSFEKPTEPDEDEVALKQEREYGKFQHSVLRTVLKNKDYQKVLEKDKTLAKVLENNPLSLLDESPVDSEDALSQVVDFLDERVEDLKEDPKKKKEEKKDDDGGQKEPAPPITVEKTKGEKEQEKTLEDVSKGIMGKVTVGGKSAK